MSDLMTAVFTLRGRQTELEKAQAYYEGDQDEVFASPKLKRALKNTGTSFRINFARTPVDSVLNRLEIAAVTSTSTQATDLISQVWGDNDLSLEMDEIHRWTLVYGDGYVMVWPDEDTGKIEVSFNSPRLVHLFYESENPRMKRFAAKMWKEGEKTRVNLYYADRIEKYITKAKSAKKEGDFIPYEVDGEEWPLENPFGEVPVFHFRTMRPFGRPEHKDAFGPQDMVNKLIITQMASNDFHGFPQRYVLAGGASSEATDFDEDTGDAQETVNLNSGPGELWWLTGENLNVGQFDAADPDAFLKPFEQYVRAMASVTNTPLHYFEGMKDAPSGESLRAAEAPLIKKVTKRQALFGSSWEEVFKFVLRISGISGAVDVRWHTAQSLDDLDSWKAAKAKQEAGVPVRQTLLEAGYTEDQVNAFENIVLLAPPSNESTLEDSTLLIDTPVVE